MLLVEFYDGREVCETLISDQVQTASPRYDVMTDFTIFTATYTIDNKMKVMGTYIKNFF